MKKLLLLITLFTSLFIGFVSCSDDSKVIICEAPLFTIVGNLSYNKDSSCYFLAIDKISDKLVNDTLIPNRDESEGRIETVKMDTSQILRPKIYELIGSNISVSVGFYSLQKIEGVYTLLIEDIDITKLPESKSTNGVYIVDSEPEIFPEAYTTVPLSRATYNMSGHYEISG